ncbi:hypothetical protein QBC44DRAFT_400370 [Cladorrhinum sp. PSN332]|nr:hypothetical protein QBC44DRAFT_400370 [Cladorrhinum sp. PSN332]
MHSRSLLALVAAASAAWAQTTTELSEGGFAVETSTGTPTTTSSTLSTITTTTAREVTTSTANPNITMALFVAEAVVGAATPTVFANLLESDAARTIYSIQCRGGRSAGAPCGIIHDAKVTVGADPSTVDIQATERITNEGGSPKTFRDLSVTAHCDINSGTATCFGTSRSATVTESTTDGRVVETTVNQDIRQLATTAASSGGHVIAITVIPERFPTDTRIGTTGALTTTNGSNQGGNGNGNGYNTPGPSPTGSAVQNPASPGAAPRMTQGAAVIGVMAAVGGVMAML